MLKFLIVSTLKRKGEFVLLVGVASIVLLICLFLIIFGHKAPSLTGVVILNNLTGKFTRSHGPGMFLMVPGLEEVAHEVDLLKRSASVKDDFETADEATIPLTVTYEYTPWYKHLAQFVLFGRGAADACFKSNETKVTARLKSIADIVIEKKANRKEAMDNLGVIAYEIKKKFEETLDESGTMTLQQYYGINLLAVMLSGVGQPQEVKDAIARREAAEEENKIRIAKMATTRQMANALVNEVDKRVEKAKKQYPDHPERWPMPMNLEKALEIVQKNEGIIKEEIKKVAVEKDTQEAVSAAIEKFFSSFWKGRKP